MSWMDEFERMRRQVERLTRDLAPSIEIIDQFQRQHDWVKLGRELMTAAVAAEEQFETLRRLSEPNYFADLSALVARHDIDFRKLLASRGPSIPGQWTDVSRAIQSLKTLAGPAAFASATTEFLVRSREAEAGTDSGAQSVAGAIEQEYLRDAGRIELTPATAQFILSVLLTLLLFWLSQRSNAESEARILDRIDQIETAIEETVGVLEPSGEVGQQGATRAVERSATVLSRPNGRSGRALGLVYKDQVVLVRGQRGKWCQIEWLDLRDRSLKVGWVLKKYLTRVQN